MSIDSVEIKKALDHFENDEFTDAKEIVSKEIRKVRDEFLQDKLKLKASEKSDDSSEKDE